MTLANGRSLDNRTDIYSCTVTPDDHMVPYDGTGTVCAALAFSSSKERNNHLCGRCPLAKDRAFSK